MTNTHVIHGVGAASEIAINIPTIESMRSTTNERSRAVAPTRRLPWRDVELPLDERVRQLAEHEAESRPRAERGVARDESGQRLRATLGATADSDDATAPRTPRGRGNHHDESAHRLVVTEHSASANAEPAVERNEQTPRDSAIRSHAECARPASTNATMRKRARASASVVWRHQMSAPVSRRL